MQINESKIAFICFHLFFGIGPFQWVAADKNKKSFAAFAGLEGLKRGLSPLSNGLAGGSSYSSADRKSYSRHCHFPQQIVALSRTVNCLTLARSPPWAA
jgi:hypothetical protein